MDDNQNEVTTITNLIQSYLTQIETKSVELKKHREMLEDSFNNDPTYRDHADKVKEAVKIRNATKAQITKQPAVMELKLKVNELSKDVKEAKQSLSDYLTNYQKLTGLDSFETPDGQVRQIIYTAKLVKVGG